MEQETSTANIKDADQTVISSTDTDFDNHVESTDSTSSTEENKKKGVIKKVGLAAGTAVATALGVGLLSSFRNPENGEPSSTDAGRDHLTDGGGLPGGGAGGAAAASDWWQTAPHAEEGVVTNDMSFNEAFTAARKSLGAGGVFEWNGKTFGTFYKEECDENGQPLDKYLSDDSDPNSIEPPTMNEPPEVIAGKSDDGDDTDPKSNGGDILANNDGETPPVDTHQDSNPDGSPDQNNDTSDPQLGDNSDGGKGDNQQGDPDANGEGEQPEQPEQVDTILANSNTMEYDSEDDGYAETVYVDVDKDGHADMIVDDMNHDGKFTEEEVMIINEDALAEGAEIGDAKAGEMNVDYDKDGQADMLYTDIDQDGIVDTIVQDSNQDGDFKDEEMTIKIDNSNNIGSVIGSEGLADVVEDTFGSESDDVMEEDSELYADASEEDFDDNDDEDDYIL